VETKLPKDLGSRKGGGGYMSNNESLDQTKVETPEVMKDCGGKGPGR